MTEPKPKNANSGPNAKGSPSKLRESLRSLCCLAVEVKQEMDGLPQYEAMLTRNKELGQALAAKNTEIQKLQQAKEDELRGLSNAKQATIDRLKAELDETKNAKNVLFKEFGEQYKNYMQAGTAAESLEDQVAKLKDQLKKKQEELKTAQAQTADLRKEADRAKKEAKNLSITLADAQNKYKLDTSKLANQVAKLQDCQHNLQKLEREVGRHQLIEFGQSQMVELKLSLDKFSQQCHSLMMQFFKGSIGALTSTTALKDLRDHFPKIPMPPLSSPHAAQMLCALAEALVAEVLASHIFCPFLLPYDLQGPASVISGLLREDSGGKEESGRDEIFCCQMLEFSSSRIDAHLDVVSPAAEHVHKLLISFLPPTSLSPFKESLVELFTDGVELWKGVQRAKVFIFCEPVGTIDYDELLPDRYEQYDAAVPPNAIKLQSGQEPEILALLFPRVVTANAIIHSGAALWSNQSSVVSAKHDLAGIRMNGSDLTRQGSSRRRLSFVEPTSAAPR